MTNKAEKWLDTATSGIRFGPDRSEVREELKAHIEDKMADLRRIFPDIPTEEAADRVLGGMGDPEEVKKELARVHKPWLGWLWQFSKGLLWGAIAVCLLTCVWKNDYFQSAGFPLWMDWTAHHAAPAEVSPEWAEAGDFTFKIVEGVYLEDRDEYLLSLRVSSPRFWEKISAEALYRGLTSVTPEGTRWPMGRTADELPAGTVHLARWGLFSREFGIYIPAGERTGEDWVTLELESRLGSFTLSALVTERVEEP